MAKAAKTARAPRRKPAAQGQPDDLSITGEAIELWPMEDLSVSPRNPRAHSPEQVAQLAASMREYGWTIPLLVDEGGEIIAGAGRFTAAKQMGWAEAKVIVARGWSDERKAAYRILDNRLAENSSWDRDLLTLELAALEKAGEPIDTLGFTPAQLQEYLAGLDSRGGFLSDLAAGAGPQSTRAASKEGATTVALTFQLVPAERDAVIAFLAGHRDRWGLRNTAEALVRLAKEELVA